MWKISVLNLKWKSKLPRKTHTKKQRPNTCVYNTCTRNRRMMMCVKFIFNHSLRLVCLPKPLLSITIIVIVVIIFIFMVIRNLGKVYVYENVVGIGSPPPPPPKCYCYSLSGRETQMPALPSRCVVARIRDGKPERATQKTERNCERERKMHVHGNKTSSKSF